ncbi:MAG: hypothetical protein LWX83_06845 [Anaerolineae bacterium]|nr:hypothetical protein [Anaerolineae bacterium]
MNKQQNLSSAGLENQTSSNRNDDFIEKLGGFLFSFPRKQISVPYFAWVGFLYIGGLCLWANFLNWGSISFDFHDWYEITGPRLYFMQNAIIQGVMPLHMSGTSALVLLTDRFLSIPDIIVSPQILLLRWLTPADFILVNWLFLYTLGFIGMLIFARRFKLSPFVLTVIFLIFNFNGHIESHLSIGHYTWGGYFLISWFVLFVFELQDHQPDWRWIGKMAFLLTLIFMQGSFHQFVGLLIFLMLLALTYPKHFWQLFITNVFACLLAAFRIFPVALIVKKVDQVFIGGFPGAWEVLKGMLELRNGTMIIDGYSWPLNTVSTWEFDFYLGIAGVLFILIFGIYCWIKYPVVSMRFFIPLAILTLLSLGGVYQLVRLFSFPLFDGERVTTRFLMIPMAFLIFVASIYSQQWINSRRLSRYSMLLLCLGVMVLGSDLWSHYEMWNFIAIRQLFEGNLHVFNPALWNTANYNDSLYIGILKRSMGISVTSAVLLIIMAVINPSLKLYVNLTGYLINHHRQKHHHSSGVH